MQVQYLEIVTKEAEAACELYGEIHGVSFGEPDPNLGGARTAEMADGSKFAVRAPMHDGEKPVTRAYVLVDDIEKAVENAKKAGAQIAVPPMPIPGHGTCAIYFHGGIEAGLWQRES
ncbi:MAG TPA: hydroxylase [Planctomycetaceae bacterium]|nr:hydroxylase [Planctomycetaceae bacterium]